MLEHLELRDIYMYIRALSECWEWQSWGSQRDAHLLKRSE